MKIRFGYRELEYPSSALDELKDSSHLLEDPSALREQMAKDGYLLMRRLIDRDKVLNARERVLSHMDEHKALTPDTPLLEGVMPKDGRSVQMMGRKGIVRHEDVNAVLEADELFDFFEGYFSEPALTFNYKWLRAVGNEEYTGAHCDYVYMGQGSPNLHTVWIPFGDIPIEQGTLAICPASHRLESFARLRKTYGRMDVDRDAIEGWFTKEPMEIVENFGSHWVTGDFAAGDVILFGMHTMHASTTNLTNRFRLSCDVRYQPATEPADKRWVGEGSGHSIHGHQTLQSIEEARAQWGV